MPHLERHLEKIVAEVRKRVPEAELEATEERLPRWSIANRAAWLEYNVNGKLMICGTKGGGSTVTVKHKRDESAAEAATTITELLVQPVAPVEEGAERPA